MLLRTGIPAGASDAATLIVGAMRAADALIVIATGASAYWLRHASLELPGSYWNAITIGTLLALNYMHFARLYQYRSLRRLAAHVGHLTGAWAAVAVSLIAIAYATKTSEDYSRIWAGLWATLSYVGFLAVRLAATLQLARLERAGNLSLRVAIVGAGEAGEALVRSLTEAPDSGLRLVGLFDDDPAHRTRTVAGQPVLGTVDDLLRLGRENRIDEVIIALPWGERGPLLAVIHKLRTLPVNVKLCPETIADHIPPLGFSSVAGIPMLDIYERPLSGWSIVTKAVEDRVLAVLILLLSFPLLALIAVLVRLDSPGPVLFRQKRYGFNNNEFTVYKFRTMRASCAAEPATPQARRDDPRVTRIGAFLRRTSLDETPQLINVLRGEMSLVGPRPHAVAHNVEYAAVIDDYLSRHRVKPGITGWAQVNGFRGETDTPEKMRLRVQHDLQYIENWSLLLDLKILALTLFVGFVNRNAY